ncbi:cyclodeaminase/cyclohydrolase family protein [Paenibacillus sp. GCM10027626]|uniref:cyclodeaminase/cyclohydrolase family protein n=1 Tax=Paenibacillus sp. GCM10027626 TaxID=3273411 RepID=UPI00363E7086
MQNVTWNDSIQTFITQAGSANPTPGGGSVAALAAALGAAMTSMVGNLSQGEKFASCRQLMSDTVDKMNLIITRSEQLMIADMTLFQVYMSILKLPKDTEAEKLLRKQTLQKAVINATDVPMQLVTLCKEGLFHTCQIADAANKQVISDLGIGAILLDSAAQSAALTAEINLASIQDMELKQQYSDNLRLLLHEIGELKEQVVQTTRSRIGN